MEFPLRATTLITRASLYGGFTVSRAEAVATRMREIGLLPKGGRGLHAPALSALEVGAFFLTLAGAERVDDVPQVLSHLNQMVDKSGRPLLARIASIVESPNEAFQVDRILVLTRNPMTAIEWQNGSVSRYFLPTVWRPGFVAEAQGQGFIGQIGYIGGALLHQVALDFKAPDGDEDDSRFDLP